LKEPFKVEAGFVKVPKGPGLGIELDEAKLASKIGHDWRNKEEYDPDDGSVVDW
jgi:galactonate dehydratase